MLEVIAGKEKTIEHIVSEIGFLIEEDEDDVSCCLCDSLIHGVHRIPRNQTYQKTAEEIWAEGWRIAVSNAYALEGLMCPFCVQGKDEE